jgi:hypothetical protein
LEMVKDKYGRHDDARIPPQSSRQNLISYPVRVTVGRPLHTAPEERETFLHPHWKSGLPGNPCPINAAPPDTPSHIRST